MVAGYYTRSCRACEQAEAWAGRATRDECGICLMGPVFNTMPMDRRPVPQRRLRPESCS